MMNFFGGMHRNVGRITGEAGSNEFQTCIRDVRNDPGVVELTVDAMELDSDSVNCVTSLIRSRNWKSITLHDSSELAPSSNNNVDDIDEGDAILITTSMNHSIRLEFRGGIVHRRLAESFSTGLLSATSQLKKFSLVRSKINLEIASMIGEAVGSSPMLEDFSLTSCIVNDESLMGLLGTTGSTLRGLYLSDCNLNDEHIEQIGAALIYHPNLKQLWLNGRQEFGSSKPLLEGLKDHHTELEHIQLPNSNQVRCPHIQNYLEYNRGGRRLLGNPDASVALWPLVLERVGRIGGLSNQSRSNILYFLVRELHGSEQIH